MSALLADEFCVNCCVNATARTQQAQKVSQQRTAVKQQEFIDTSRAAIDAAAADEERALLTRRLAKWQI